LFPKSRVLLRNMGRTGTLAPSRKQTSAAANADQSEGWRNHEERAEGLRVSLK
jgi:hypothetical protein